MCNTGRGSSLWMDGSTSRSGKGFACMSCFIGYPCLAGYLLCIDHLIGRSTEASQNGLSNCEITVICFNSHQAPVRIGVIFKHLRKLMDSLLERKLANPKMNLEGNFNRTSNWLLNEWIIIFIVSQSVYLYAYLFEQSFCCEHVFHFYPLQMRRPYRSSQNWSSQKTGAEEVPVCIQPWIDYDLNSDKPHRGVRL